MENDNTEEIGKQAAALSLIEIGLGSLLHSFKIPMSGHLLSINQIALLSRSCFKLESRNAALQISLIASLLKSLSPAGKKLTPMLAIAAQGLFYYIGISLAGINYVGLLFAVIIASLWAFIQPVLFIFLLFGKTSMDVAKHFLHEFEKFIPEADKILIWAVIGLVLLKCVVAYYLSLLAIKMSDFQFDDYQKKMLLNIKVKPTANQSVLFLVIRDLLNPLFLISFAMTLLFFIYSNSSMAQIIWGLLRPLAVGFILFYIIRTFPMQNVSQFLHRKGFTQLGKVLDTAIKIIKVYRGG